MCMYCWVLVTIRSFAVLRVRELAFPYILVRMCSAVGGIVVANVSEV